MSIHGNTGIKNNTDECPFCNVDDRSVLIAEGPCFAVYDRFPVASHHVLILPKRHISSFLEMTGEEWTAVHLLAKKLYGFLKEKDPSISGFNLGINDGASAGQTVFHAHIHWIPRRTGDVAQPRGGVRSVIPGKADYSTNRPAR